MKILKYIDKWLLLITILLLAIGSIMIFSASNVSFYMRYANSPYQYLFKQIVILVIGLFASVTIFLFNVRFSTKVASILNYGFMISLVLLFVVGEVTNHAQSWFDFGFFSLQPSEFLKITTIMYLANYYDNKKKDFSNVWTSIKPIGICFVACLLIFFQPDLGTAIIYALLVAFIFLLSSVDKKIKNKIMGIGMGIVVIGALILMIGGNNLLSERQMSRITSVISNESPCDEENYYTDGNQVCNGYIAINNGGLKGLGLGKSIQKYLYLPEAHTDFIFCIIIEELGLLFGLFIIFLYILLLSRIIIIGKRSLNNRDALICYGGAFYIFIHIMVNLCGVFGILPMTGVPLPFLSYGGSYTLCLIAILTIIQKINVETKIKLAHNVGKKKKNA